MAEKQALKELIGSIKSELKFTTHTTKNIRKHHEQIFTDSHKITGAFSVRNILPNQKFKDRNSHSIKEVEKEKKTISIVKQK